MNNPMVKKVIKTFIISTISFIFSFNIFAQEAEKDIFAWRRQQLLDKMEDGVAVLTSSTTSVSNAPSDYVFRPDNDFYYLTGFDEPNSALLLIPGEKKQFIMFVQAQNPAMATWVGKRSGIEGAINIYGADTAYSIREFEEILIKIIQDKKKLWYSTRNTNLKDFLTPYIKNQAGSEILEISDPLAFIHEMRLFKSEEEIDLLRKAIDITCDSHIEAMKVTVPGMFEYEVEAVIEYIYRKNGGRGPGFPSIVGSGPNSTILHHEKNDRKTVDGDMMVMDIGCEYGYYTADITRTIPVNGIFSKEQKDIYMLVLQAQKAAIEVLKPGYGMHEGHIEAAKVIKRGLYKLGLMTDTTSSWQERLFVLYNSSHWLGLHVHDVGRYGRENGKGRPLEPGMVLTIEPGIYINKDMLDNLSSARRYIPQDELTEFINKVSPLFEKYNHIGVRIEDDILITEEGNEVLSAKAPKTISEIEETMSLESLFK